VAVNCHVIIRQMGLPVHVLKMILGRRLTWRLLNPAFLLIVSDSALHSLVASILVVISNLSWQVDLLLRLLSMPISNF
jgi:hypothetical protein